MLKPTRVYINENIAELECQIFRGIALGYADHSHIRFLEDLIDTLYEDIKLHYPTEVM